MIVKQVSIFLENKSGRISSVTRILGEHGINMHAFSVADSVEFGIMRLVVSDVDKAVKVLKEANFAVRVTDVVCITISDEAGSLSRILEQLDKEHIFIEYMYAFSEGDKARIVIRPSDVDKCLKVLT